MRVTTTQFILLAVIGVTLLLSIFVVDKFLENK